MYYVYVVLGPSLLIESIDFVITPKHTWIQVQKIQIVQGSRDDNTTTGRMIQVQR